MTLTYPLGLLALIGIPIVILIYILRSKYNEQTVTSTFLWRLSDKFLKRKNPLSGLTGLISLILQILVITAIAFSLARPVFVLKGMASNYCFVLDGSASMNISSGKDTRFDIAKEEIIDEIKGTKAGSTYSLIYVADTSYTVFEAVKSKDTAVRLVEDLKPSYTHSGLTDALTAAQSYFDDNSSSTVFLVTDTEFENHSNNVEIITVGDKSMTNFGVFDVEYSMLAGKLTATADVVAYGTDADLTLKMWVDGNDSRAVEKTVSVEDGKKVRVTLECPASSFSFFDIEVSNTDSYPLDNKITTHNPKSEDSYSILVVSDEPFFLEAVLDALTDSRVNTMSPKKYEQSAADGADDSELGFGLYIFDSFEPSKLPAESAVWLINTDESIENSGFSVRGRGELKSPELIEKSGSTASAVRKLLTNIEGNQIYVNDYVKYSGIYLNFSTLFTCESYPVVFAGANALGNRQVVFGFDIHGSDIALSTDFVVLMKNLLDYSFPSLVDKTDFTVGDEVTVNVKANSENLKAQTPSGREIYLESSGITADLLLDEVGTYTISMTTGGIYEKCTVFSAAHSGESNPSVTESEFVLAGEKGNERTDGEFDAVYTLFIILLVLMFADWGVYCYEKYQLR